MSLLLCVFFSLLLLPNIKSSLLYKCPDFHLSSGKAEMGKKRDNDSNTLIIPSHLMSHFQSYEFRLVSGNVPVCDINNEVIKISLIGTDIINIASNPSQQQPIPLLDYNDIEQFPLLNNSDMNNDDARPLPKSRSNLASLIYSVDNITAISNTSYLEEERPRCERKLSRQDVQFTPTGFLFHFEEYYRPLEFCIQAFNEDENWIGIRKCHINCRSESTPCIPLCCHLHEFVNLSVPCCEATHKPKPMFQPIIYDNINRRLSLEETIDSTGISDAGGVYAVNKQVKPHYVTFKFNHVCPDGLQPHHLYFNENGDSSYNSRIYIQTNGKVLYIGDDRQWHHLENFCVAGIGNTGVDSIKNEDGIEMTMVLKYCLEDEGQPETMWPSYMYIGVFSFSSIFLVLTVIVYVLLWDKQNIHGWTILSFVTSELFLFIFLAVSYSFSVFSMANETSRTVYCVGSAIFAHFFFLSTFTWLTIINLDLWWTFNNFTPISERSKGKKRFCLYMMFAWGLPTLVVTTGLILGHIYRSNEHSVIVPDYGNRRCFLSIHAKGVYLYYIIGTLLLVNFILISCTVVTIYKFKKGARIASTSSSKTKERSFKLFIKLVVVMGVTWSLEFVPWLISWEGFTWLIFTIDVFNILQAVATFIIFVCKRKILNQLEQKYPSLSVITKPILKVLANRSGTIMSSSESKQTRSTTMTSATTSSVLQRSKRKSQKVATADSKI